MTKQSAIHHMLAILAGDLDAPTDSFARLIARLGWGGLTPDTPDGRGDYEVATWFVRVTFPGITPTEAFIVDVATAAGLRVESLAEGAATAPSAPVSTSSRAIGARADRWLLVGPQSRSEISAAVARLRAVHRIHAVPFRTVEDQ